MLIINILKFVIKVKSRIIAYDFQQRFVSYPALKLAFSSRNVKKKEGDKRKRRARASSLSLTTKHSIMIPLLTGNM